MEENIVINYKLNDYLQGNPHAFRVRGVQDD
jgi:hypothetical protein